MTEISSLGWAYWATVMVMASLSGGAFSRLLPWTGGARAAGVPAAFGCALAPFLAGLASVLALGLLPGARHGTHLAIVVALLAAFAVGTFLTSRLPRFQPADMAPPVARPAGILWVALLGLAAIWVAFILFEALVMPLTQNDSLEYATVGRMLFESRDLGSYPALDPNASPSGFFGPWTHPPLYAASIYLAYVAQGHADMPGLMRLVSPWFVFSMAYLLFALGSMANRLTGLLAAILMLSAPLVALGSGSGLIDALPMSGLLLVTASIAHLQGPWRVRAVVVGLMLGLALWTHSQAVLFLPMVLVAVLAQAGLMNLREGLKQALLVLGAAALVAAWPYARNIGLFGSPISDTPVVFAMPELGWKDYFAMARGLESWSEKLQYGILKGLFVPESYAAAFWLLVAGLVMFFRGWTWPHLREVARGGFEADPRRWMLVLVVLVASYFGGVVLSTLIGVDLMIRNDRYLLVMVPLAALAGATALARWLSAGVWLGESAAPGRHNVVSAALIMLMLMSVVQWLLLANYENTKRQRLVIRFDRMVDTQVAKLRYWPSAQAAFYLRNHAPPDAVVLSGRPADMYYASRRMISYLDPRLLPFYRESDAVKGLARLRELGVTHIQLPGYSHPSIYNSTLQEITGRADLTTLAFAVGGEQIYTLAPASKQGGAKVLDLAPGQQEWVKAVRFTLGGKRALSVLMSVEAPSNGDESRPGIKFPLLERSWTTMLMTGSNPDYREIQAGADVIPVASGSEYLLELGMEGAAYAFVYVFQYDRKGSMVGQERVDAALLSEIALKPRNGTREVRRRFVSDPDAVSIRIAIEHRGDAFLALRSGRLVHLGP